MITSRLTSKARTTIPQAVRTELGLEEGDGLAYTIEAGRVIVTRAPLRKGDPLDDPFAAFWEWDTEEDEQAFADLQEVEHHSYAGEGLTNDRTRRYATTRDRRQHQASPQP